MTDVVMPQSVEYYLNHISQYEREFKKWEGRVKKIVDRYKDESRNIRDSDGSRFNVLWSNVQTLKASTFSRIPQPDVSRLHRDNDPVGRVACLILERALEFEIEHYADYRQTLRQSVYDRFLGGRGIAWVRYEPTFTQSDIEAEITEDVEAENPISEQLDFEAAPTDYVHWKDFGHSVARTWEEVSIVWRKVYLTRQALQERFGDDADRIPLDASPTDTKNTDPDGVDKRALIIEIWDKEAGRVFWLSKSLGKFVDEKDDPLELEGFFPCPRPLYATLTNDSLVPVPDFTLYQDQAAQLDILSDRIDGLIKALKVFGVYDSSIPELSRLFKEGGNTELLPVKNWGAFAEKNGLSGSIQLVEIAPIARALNDAYTAFGQIKSQIYEITGISDILRGETQASETATAQNIKNNYATLRLKVYQDEVSQYATSLLRLKAQIICKHFDDMTILRMAGADQLSPVDQQMLPMAMQLLRNDVSRNFRVDVAADSLVFADEQQEKQDRMDFLSATSAFIEKIVQGAAQAPQIVPIAIELLKFGVAGFKVGKTMEGVIDEAAEQVKSQPQQQPPNPEMIKAQVAQQQQQAQIQHEQQVEQFKAQAETQIEQSRIQADIQIKQQQMQVDAQQEELKRQHDATMKQMAVQMQQQLATQQQDFDRWKAELDAATRIAVAQIGASAKAIPDGAELEPTPEQYESSAIPAVLEKLEQLLEITTQPKIIERGPDGKAKSINGRPILRDPDSKIIGIQ
jgi:hypothetical protein